MNIIFLLVNIGLGLIGFPMVMKMFENNKVIALNYRKEEIPICLGIVFIFIQIATLPVYYIINNDARVLVYLVGLLSIGLVGLLDDLTGDIYVKGLKGHINSFFKGELTTGFLKAGIGFYISLIISIFISKDIANTILNTFLIALSINSLNLFDLRPGRCLKVFTFLSLLFLLLGSFRDNFIILSILVVALVYFRYDIKAKAMMGDVGSNVLGLSLGFYSALTHSIYIRVLYIIFLLGLHILAERVSISKIIENNKFLKYIDELGR